jgi:hypothetical protein
MLIFHVKVLMLNYKIQHDFNPKCKWTCISNLALKISITCSIKSIPTTLHMNGNFLTSIKTLRISREKIKMIDHYIKICSF